MLRKKTLKQIWSTIKTMNESIESHNRTLSTIIESLESLSALVKELTDNGHTCT